MHVDVQGRLAGVGRRLLFDHLPASHFDPESSSPAVLNSNSARSSC